MTLNGTLTLYVRSPNNKMLYFPIVFKKRHQALIKTFIFLLGFPIIFKLFLPLQPLPAPSSPCVSLLNPSAMNPPSYSVQPSCTSTIKITTSLTTVWKNTINPLPHVIDPGRKRKRGFKQLSELMTNMVRAI